MTSKLAIRAKSAPCTYCQRPLANPRHNGGKTSATWDHVHPKSKGGRVKVPACRQCNQLKGDLTAPEWDAFRAAHPRWWKTFHTHQEVRAAAAVIPSVAQNRKFQWEHSQL